MSEPSRPPGTTHFGYRDVPETDKARLEGELAQQVQRILALQESYPDLKASDNFLGLQRDLVDVEDHLQYARRFYNGAVRELNDGVQKFPDLLIANAFGFHQAEFFEAPNGAEIAPKLELSQ